MIVASLYSQKPPELYYGIGIGLFLCLVIPSVIFVWNYLHRPSHGTYTIPARGTVSSIQQYPPSIGNDNVEIRGNRIFGYTCVATFRLKNNRGILLDHLSAEVEVNDVERNKTKRREVRLPDLLPNESINPVVKVGLGRRRSAEQKVAMIIKRSRVEVVRVHVDF